VANTLKLFRQGAVGFIDWLDGFLINVRDSVNDVAAHLVKHA
jgi:hypothetical protein